ncbi:MAG: hypothetical protein NW220_07745 [Leptolyngbyaceae cyanobacterium bins.349]|nr:hypothetical protein [Leptolyngbyaceae cyanobacterium bins.349]
MQDIYALSIAGPFSYWLASAKETSYGIKQIELRSWKRYLQPGTIVLIHSSSNSEYDHWFAPLGISKHSVPKFSLIGAATFQGCRLYSSEELWEQDRRIHCWMGNENWETVYGDYGGNLVGHVFTNPILFPKPIPNVPGEFGYWKPNPKKPQFERQQKGFDLAISQLQRLQYKPDFKPEPELEKPKRESQRKPKPNQVTVYYHPHLIEFVSHNCIWDYKNPPSAFVETLKNQTQFFKDEVIGHIYMTQKEIKTQYLKYSSTTKN